MKRFTRAAAVVVATAVLAIATHAGGGVDGAAVWCLKHGQSTNGTCPVPPPTSL